MIPIDPIAALEGLQSAIGMVKKASKVANDLGSLAPMLGKLFDAKSTAIIAHVDAIKSKPKQSDIALIHSSLEVTRRIAHT